MAPKGSSDARYLYFAGWSWESSVSADDLQALRRTYNILKLAVLEIHRRRVATMDFDGMASQVALYPLMIANYLHLPFCHLIQDVLNFLKLAPAQLHPNTLQLLVASYVIF